MTVSLEILEKEEDLNLLYPIIKKMAVMSKFPFPQLLHEVILSMRDPNYITIIGKEEGEIKTYISGYFLNPEEFYLSQGMKTFPEKRPDVILDTFNFLEDHLRAKGAKRMIGLSLPPPEVFEKYGWKLQRYLINKELL